MTRGGTGTHYKMRKTNITCSKCNERVFLTVLSGKLYCKKCGEYSKKEMR